MNDGIHLEALLAASAGTGRQQLALFGLLSLGITDLLANGLIGASNALRVFFNAENCSFVRKRLRDKTADEIMSRGVQLPDLFDALPAEEAQREFQRELAALRSLCLKLLEEKQLVA
ncbi:MAG TPA: hypothetical protein VKA46_19630 [Gemmataceae bacterium]|nr:hypothetical protein [Gemmataceae bacterium]